MVIVFLRFWFLIVGFLNSWAIVWFVVLIDCKFFFIVFWFLLFLSNFCFINSCFCIWYLIFNCCLVFCICFWKLSWVVFFKICFVCLGLFIFGSWIKIWLSLRDWIIDFDIFKVLILFLIIFRIFFIICLLIVGIFLEVCNWIVSCELFLRFNFKWIGIWFNIVIDVIIRIKINVI